MTEENEEVTESEAENKDLPDVEYQPVPASTKRETRRAHHLAQKVSSLGSENARLREELREREKALMSHQEALRRSEEEKNEAFQTSLVQEEERILREMKSAKEEGDIDKDVHLTQELAKIKADQSSLEVMQIIPRDYPSQTSDESDVYSEPIGDYEEDSETQQENSALLQFYHNNPQADPESSVYNPEFRSLADFGANKISEMYRESNNEHLIGSPEFFSLLHRSLNRSIAKTTKVNPGVSRPGSSMADIYASRNAHSNVTGLTQQELRIARNLPGNMSESKKIELYAKYKAEESNYEPQEL